MSRGSAPWLSRRTPAPAPDREPGGDDRKDSTWQGWDSDADDEDDERDDEDD
jgi:hypothetical protein